MDEIIAETFNFSATGGSAQGGQLPTPDVSGAALCRETSRRHSRATPHYPTCHSQAGRFGRNRESRSLLPHHDFRHMEFTGFPIKSGMTINNTTCLIPAKTLPYPACHSRDTCHGGTGNPVLLNSSLIPIIWISAYACPLSFPGQTRRPEPGIQILSFRASGFPIPRTDRE